MDVKKIQKLKKIITRAAELEKGKTVALAKQFLDLEEKIDDIHEEVKKKESGEFILEIPKEELKGDKGDNYILTLADKKEISRLIKVPVVEKVIEKTETIVEQPLITQEIKEVAKYEEREEIVKKINTGKKHDLKIERKQIEGLEKLLTQDELDRAIGILDQRTQFLINKTTRVVTDATLTGDGSSESPLHAVGDGMGDMLKATYDPGNINGNAFDYNNFINTPTNISDFVNDTGFITDLSSFTTTNLADSLNKRYVTDADLIDIGNLSGVNTGDVTVTDSSEIDFTLTGQNITAVLKTNSIDESKLDASVNASLDLADSALQSLSGAVLTDQTVGQTVGTTGSRLTKLWATDITVTNAIAGSITGNAGTVTNGVYTTGAGSVFEVPLTFSTGLTRSTNTITVNTTQNIAKLSNLTSNGFVKTSGSDGTLSIDTNTYLTGNQTITLSGDISGSGTTAITTTLGTVNANVGTFGSSSQSAQLTVNGKGLVTAVSNVSIDHNALTNLATGDVHTQYALLAGRTGATNNLTISTSSSGAIINLSSASGGGGLINSTSNATKGTVAFGSLTTGLIYDQVNNRVGVGITPNYKLEISSTDAEIHGVYHNRSYTGITSGTKAGLRNRVTANPSGGDNVGTNAGFWNGSYTNSGNANNYTSSLALVGSFYECFHQGSGTVNGMAGQRLNVGMATGAGNVTNREGVSVNLISDGNTVGTSYGFRIYVTADAGTITTGYGYYSPANSAATDDWGFYSLNAKNHMSGSLGLGTTSFGTSAAKVLAIGNGTAPASSPADVIQLWAADTVAGQSNLYARNENGKSEQITGLADRVSTQFDKTNTTLSAITGLSINVEAGKAYYFEVVLFVDANVTGGSKYSMSGTATATSIIYETTLLDDGTNALTLADRQTTLNTTGVGQASTTAGMAMMKGTIVVNAAGTLTPMFAQNAASGTSSVLVGSTFILKPIGD